MTAEPVYEVNVRFTGSRMSLQRRHLVLNGGELICGHAFAATPRAPAGRLRSPLAGLRPVRGRGARIRRPAGEAAVDVHRRTGAGGRRPLASRRRAWSGPALPTP